MRMMILHTRLRLTAMIQRLDERHFANSCSILAPYWIVIGRVGPFVHGLFLEVHFLQ